MEPLVEPSALEGFPGAPFNETVLAAASGQVRDLCGWHIAPSVTETITLDSDGSTILALPSLHVDDVTEVRDVTRSPAETIGGWRLSGQGMLYRPARWPAGVAAVEVDLVHGYEKCPEGLLSVVAERAQFLRRDRSVGQESLGSRSISIRSERAPTGQGQSTSEQVLARYTVTGGP